MHTQLIRKLVEGQAVIFPGTFAGAYAAYPNGDRRKRPVCWLDANQFKHIRAEGLLEKDGEGFRIVRSYARRCLHATAETAHAAQQCESEERDIYIPEGSLRKARHNRGQTPLRRLAKTKNRAGNCEFSAAEVEAGERFARDYHFAHMENMTTLNYAAVGGRDRASYGAGTAVDLSAARLDVRNRIMKALRSLGPGLDRAVISVCVNEMTLEKLERTEHWMRSSGRTILKLALQRLVDFYGTEAGRY